MSKPWGQHYQLSSYNFCQKLEFIYSGSTDSFNSKKPKEAGVQVVISREACPDGQRAWKRLTVYKQMTIVVVWEKAWNTSSVTR